MLEKLKTTTLLPLRKVKRKVGYDAVTPQATEVARLQLKRMRIQEEGDDKGISAQSQAEATPSETAEAMHTEL